MIQRIITIAALAFAVGNAALATLPGYVLPSAPIVVVGPGCPAADVALHSSLDILPLVTAPSPGGTVGETASGEASCKRIATAMRREHAAFELVPQSYLCRSVRARAIGIIKAADLWVGTSLWILDGRAVGPATLYEELTSRGIAYARVGERVEIASIP
jgi:hypothetical protein